MFPDWTRDRTERFLEFVEIMRVPHWATIVKQGDHGDAMYLVVEGELSGPNRARFKGTIRKALGPGRYRINPYAFDHQIVKLEKKDVSGNELDCWSEK